MKKHRLLAVLLILGCMINITGCNKNTVRVASSTNIQKSLLKLKSLMKVKILMMNMMQAFRKK